jgi:hypothetical protein
MNNNVVDLFKKPDPVMMRGQASCITCRFVWQAVAPVGTVWLECPNCHAEKGHFDFPVHDSHKAYWQCSCGNNLFYISKEETYCANCGIVHIF